MKVWKNESQNQHTEDVKIFFKRIKDYGFNISEEMCEFFMNTENRLQHHGTILLNYTYKMEFLPSKKLSHAGRLSRLIPQWGHVVQPHLYYWEFKWVGFIFYVNGKTASRVYFPTKRLQARDSFYISHSSRLV